MYAIFNARRLFFNSLLFRYTNTNNNNKHN